MHLPLITRIFLVLFQICILTMALPAASMDSIGIEEREVSSFLPFLWWWGEGGKRKDVIDGFIEFYEE